MKGGGFGSSGALGPGGGAEFLRIKKWKLHIHLQKIKKLYSLFRQICQHNMMKFSEFSILKFCHTIIFCKDLVLI